MQAVIQERSGQMSTYMITYGLNAEKHDYSHFLGEIEAIGNCCKAMPNVWLVHTDSDATQIYSRLKQHLNTDDNLLIVEANHDYSGWVPQNVGAWISRIQNS